MHCHRAHAGYSAEIWWINPWKLWLWSRCWKSVVFFTSGLSAVFPVFLTILLGIFCLARASVQLQRSMSGVVRGTFLVQELRQRRISHAVMIFPIAACALVAFFLALPITRASTVWLLAENHPIEWLSAILLLAGGLRGVGLAWRAHKHGEATLCVGFYLVFAIGLLFTAMEEVSWGQQLIGFETPSVWKDLNAQGETTFHNIHGLQGHTELFRLVFGLGGLIGVWVARERTLQKIAAPRILLSWFLVITMHSIVCIFNRIVPVPSHFYGGIDRLSEVVELLIGVAGLLYVELNARALAAQWQDAAARVPLSCGKINRLNFKGHDRKQDE